jgi:chemotaxis protein methyltransferase CheR
MQLAWPGYRNVRRSVCKRVDRRYRELGLPDLAAYRDHLETRPLEWEVLRACCGIPISRFYRDRAVFESLEHLVLPVLASNATRRADTGLDCWSAGCASGEEAYTLSILWQLRLAGRHPRLELRVLATDIDPALLKRATAACYRASSLRELPLAWRAEAFVVRGAQYCVRATFRQGISFVCEDICTAMPGQSFDLILCRNVAFTYFSNELQVRLARQLAGKLRAGGALVIGLHERLPAGVEGLGAWPKARAVFRREALR